MAKTSLIVSLVIAAAVLLLLGLRDIRRFSAPGSTGLPAPSVAASEDSPAFTLSGELTAVKFVKNPVPVPQINVKDLDGQTISSADWRGKVVLLNFWATWCGPCKIEIPWFLEFEKEYKDRGFAVLGVSMDEDGWQAVKPYIRDAKINYRVLLGNDQVGDLYGGVDSLPTTFLIDREGRVASVHVGLVSKTTYSDEISHLLGGGIVRAQLHWPVRPK